MTLSCPSMHLVIQGTATAVTSCNLGLCNPTKLGVWCRLNFRLTQACGEVLKEVCTDVCMDEGNVDKACGGTVLRCLGDKIDDITDEACKSELLYFQKMEVSFTGLLCAMSTLKWFWACNQQRVCGAMLPKLTICCMSTPLHPLGVFVSPFLELNLSFMAWVSQRVMWLSACKVPHIDRCSSQAGYLSILMSVT